MPHVSKPSGEKATVLLSGRFHRTRLWLTGFYVVILAAMLLTSTSFTYSTFSGRLEHRFQGIRPNGPLGMPRAERPFPTPDEVRADLMRSALFANGALLILAGIASYWLAGHTLRPIQASYERQRRFLSDASHELRTPLTILQMELENERHLSQNQDRTAHITSQLEEVGRMSQLVNDLLSLSRLDEEQAIVRPTTVLSLNTITKEATTRLSAIAKQHQVQLQVIETEDMLPVIAHQELLLQAITNLVKNAILYNKPHGTVTIRLTREHPHAKLEIADTGIGISEQDLSQIFERFYRADKSRSRHTGGSGLGLAIVQRIIDQLHGTLHIKSTLDQGTTIIVLLPLHQAS